MRFHGGTPKGKLVTNKPILKEGHNPLIVPAAELVRATGYTAAYLRFCNAIPQPDPSSTAGYKLIVSDTEICDAEAFQFSGVKVERGSSAVILSTWERYFLVQQPYELILPRVKLLNILKHVAYRAASLGGKEVFIGYPDECHYQFAAFGCRYSGPISPQTLRTLLMHFARHATFFERLNSGPLIFLKAGMTKSESGPVIYLSWKTRAERPFQLRAELNIADGAKEHPEGSAPIVLIEGDNSYGKLLYAVLLKKRSTVKWYRAGEQALESLESCEIPPQLVVCGAHLPSMSSLSFLRCFRARYSIAPVLLITKESDVLLETECIASGASAVLNRASDSRIFHAWCDNLLSLKRGNSIQCSET